MSDFLSSITGKAQNALRSAGFNPGQSGDATGGPQGGILKSHAVESIHHQLRTFQQQYSSNTTPVQKIITTQKGVALDLDSLSTDSHAHSKELYTWGQNEDPDIRDVTDRLAWINYVEGALAHTLATRYDASRAPFKALRDAETALAPRRNARAALHNQIGRVEHEQQRGNEPRLAELRQQLQHAQINDEPLEKEIALLKRKAVRESEQMKWQAVREYAEKLILLSQGANAVITALPAIPPSDKQYHGADITASVRATLQEALDNYKPGDINLPLRSPVSKDLSRSDTRSFGETHAKELSRITPVGDSVQPNIPLTPPPTGTGSALPPAPSQSASRSSSISHATQGSVGYSSPITQRTSPTILASPPPVGSRSPPLNPASLNQAPAPIPISSSLPPPVVAPNPTDPTVKIPSVTPTVAETGVPKSAGSEGPGPSSGSLLDLKSSSPTLTRGSDALPSYGVMPGSSADPAPEKSEKWESAADEKKRLEREEREKVLAAGGGVDNNADGGPSKEDDLPPYEEFPSGGV
ncbi:hypothetical protein POSPLADRAFT_1176223 [Postia placenta MAD-698-R-SB12]|uniref:Sphingolipid long chain base-responsive protein LSP1 n=1 Tax=Postia placenta MAD-698-R-SB12 TaxID=670580 RepID=A0A1X6NFK3_9APHY|nr:hypothetical protein POSPLADRAFT_1176223 [Postia placenta MAD-698-R-SB12]OSX67415.1 hypothetical protein POSPLADRAFT_1176223 [Postia placenta MAD-698-R-SB12]